MSTYPDRATGRLEGPSSDHQIRVAPRIVQAVFDYACMGVRGGRRTALYWRLLRWLSSVDGVRDWLVAFEIDGHSLYLPLSHQLPQNRLACPGYSSNLGRLAEHVKVKYPDFTLVDIGANIGDSVAIVRRRVRCPILCVEGEPRFASILGLNLSRIAPDVVRETVFITATGGPLKGAVRANAGTASIVSDAHSSMTIRTETLSSVLERHPDFHRPRFVKIDTDGFDCQILGGELELWSRARPVLFFEYDPAYEGVSLSIFDQLRAIGYASALIYDNTGEFLLHCDLNDGRLLQDVHDYYTGRGHLRYCDVCVFHAVDSELAELAAVSERSAAAASRLGAVASAGRAGRSG